MPDFRCRLAGRGSIVGLPACACAWLSIASDVRCLVATETVLDATSFLPFCRTLGS